MYNKNKTVNSNNNAIRMNCGVKKMSGIELIIRVLLTFLIMFIMVRIMGRKEISQMTFFNFVSAIAIGSIGANLAVNKQLSVGNGVLALILWGSITLLLDHIVLNSKKARIVLEGEPKIVIKNGKMMEEVMRKTKLDIDSLNSLLRQKNIFSLSDVRYAILEVNGELSVVKKEESQFPTKKDFHIPIPNKIMPLPLSVITDGNVIKKNLNEYNLDDNWLNVKLEENGIKSVKDVFYAEVQEDGSLYIDRKRGSYK